MYFAFLLVTRARKIKISNNRIISLSGNRTNQYELNSKNLSLLQIHIWAPASQLASNNVIELFIIIIYFNKDNK